MYIIIIIIITNSEWSTQAGCSDVLQSMGSYRRTWLWTVSWFQQHDIVRHSDARGPARVHAFR